MLCFYVLSFYALRFYVLAFLCIVVHHSQISLDLQVIIYTRVY